MPPPTAATPIKLTESTVLSALSTYTNDPTLAQEFYSYISSSFTHTPSTFSLLLSILGKHFLFSESKSLLLSSPPHLLLSPLPLRSYFHRLNAARLPNDSVHFFLHHSPSLNLFTSSTFSILIDSLCEHRHVQEAESLALSPSPPFLPDVKIYNLILRGWMKVGAWRRCKDFWVLMDKNKIQKDLHSYSIYMDILIKCNKAWKAVKLFKDLKKKGEFELDCVIWNTYMTAAGSVDGPDEAVRVLREMKDSGCNPNLVSYNAIVKLFCKEGRIREAYGWLYRMKKSGISPDVFTYHSFFRNSTRPNEILWLFEKMCESECRPRMDTYVMLMKKFGRWGFLRPVCMVWEKMEKHGMKPDAFAYNAMIDALLDKGMVDLAKKYDDEMLEKGLAAKPRKEFGTRYVGLDGGGGGHNDYDDDENAFSGVL